MNNDMIQALFPILGIFGIIMLAIMLESLFELIVRELYIYNRTQKMLKKHHIEYKVARRKAIKAYNHRVEELNSDYEYEPELRR